jgi:hypothetical protein
MIKIYVSLPYLSVSFKSYVRLGASMRYSVDGAKGEVKFIKK